jgi:lipopolysaccharide/colanic/teichoic acid biosynthesis glycosyltransferase
MSGVWQAMGSARVPLSEMVELDNLYVLSWSPWLDLKILLRTAAFVLARKGM